MEKYLIAEFEQYGREPIIRQMNDGTIICMSLTGGETEPRNDNYVGITRSYDRGKTWTKVEKLFAHESRGAWCTEVFTGCEVPFAIVHTYGITTPSRRYLELNNFISYTYDNGKHGQTRQAFRAASDAARSDRGSACPTATFSSLCTGRQFPAEQAFTKTEKFPNRASFCFAAARLYPPTTGRHGRSMDISHMIMPTFGNPMP